MLLGSALALLLAVGVVGTIGLIVIVVLDSLAVIDLVMVVDFCARLVMGVVVDVHPAGIVDLIMDVVMRLIDDSGRLIERVLVGVQRIVIEAVGDGRVVRANDLTHISDHLPRRAGG